MKKATVTYHAPKGDNKVVEMLGHTFFDGQSTEVVCEENNMQRLQNNKLFKVGSVSDYEPPPEKEADDAPKSGEGKSGEGKASEGKAGQAHHTTGR